MCIRDSLAEDRALSARGDDGLSDPFDPHARPAPVTAVAARERLERVDLVRARKFPEPEKDHLGALSHTLIIAGTRQVPRRRAPDRRARGGCETGARRSG